MYGGGPGIGAGIGGVGGGGALAMTGLGQSNLVGLLALVSLATVLVITGALLFRSASMKRHVQN